jgi:hypothetical protein
MTLRTIVLTVHIAAAAGWLGANFVQMVLAPRFAKASNEVAAAWTRQTIWLGERYYTTVGLLIIITGVVLVIDGDWRWSTEFILLGIVTVFVGGILGLTVFAPLADRRATALDAGDEAAAGEAMQKIIPWAVVDTVLVLLTVLAMVDRWGL